MCRTTIVERHWRAFERKERAAYWLPRVLSAAIAWVPAHTQHSPWHMTFNFYIALEVSLMIYFLPNGSRGSEMRTAYPGVTTGDNRVRTQDPLPIRRPHRGGRRWSIVRECWEVTR